MLGANLSVVQIFIDVAFLAGEFANLGDSNLLACDVAPDANPSDLQRNPACRTDSAPMLQFSPIIKQVFGFVQH